MRNQAVFEGLVFDESARALTVAYVGDAPCYVLEDGGFKRHLDAEQIDRQVIALFQEQALAHREILTEKMMELIGKDDLFTKVLIDDSLGKMDKILQTGLPEDARDMLGMVGMRIVVDVHGEIVEVKMPAQPDSGDDE